MTRRSPEISGLIPPSRLAVTGAVVALLYLVLQPTLAAAGF